MLSGSRAVNGSRVEIGRSVASSGGGCRAMNSSHLGTKHLV